MRQSTHRPTRRQAVPVKFSLDPRVFYADTLSPRERLAFHHWQDAVLRFQVFGGPMPIPPPAVRKLVV